MQVAQAHPQLLGGLPPIAGATRQHTNNGGAFGLAEQIGRNHAALPAPTGRARCRRRSFFESVQGIGIDARPVGQQDRHLDDIRQLAHIPRPTMPRQPLLSRRGQRGHRDAVAGAVVDRTRGAEAQRPGIDRLARQPCHQRAVPGVGRLVVDAILRRDYPVIQGVVLMFSFTYVIVNLIVDLLYTALGGANPHFHYVATRNTGVSDAECHAMLGYAFAALGRTDDALAQMDYAKELNPNWTGTTIDQLSRAVDFLVR